MTKRFELDFVTAMQQEMQLIEAQRGENPDPLAALAARVILRQLLFDLPELTAVVLTEVADVAGLMFQNHPPTFQVLMAQYYTELVTELKNRSAQVSTLVGWETDYRQAIADQRWEDAEGYFSALQEEIYSLTDEDSWGLGVQRVAIMMWLAKHPHDKLSIDDREEVRGLLLSYYLKLAKVLKPTR